jgi:signal transduction histidine kinase
VSRLYLRLYFTVLGSVLVFAFGAAVVWHAHGAPLPSRAHSGAIGILIALAAGVALGAFPIVRRLTMRLERLKLGAEALGAGDLAARVPVEGRDEIASLAESFNHAAARIEHLVGAHRLLLAQASHELRTPVTRIRLALDLIKDIEPQRRRGIEDDIAELDHLIEEILLASRLDAVTAREHEERVDMLALVAEECVRHGVEDWEGEPVTVQGDPRLLARAVRNLLENANRHGQAPVRVRLHASAASLELVVADAGPDIPAAEREQLFTPFHRRGNTQGHGLGLSLVRQIAQRHGGEARYALVAPGRQGFVLSLPISPDQGVR